MLKCHLSHVSPNVWEKRKMIYRIVSFEAKLVLKMLKCHQVVRSDISGILFQKLSGPTVGRDCSSDWEFFCKKKAWSKAVNLQTFWCHYNDLVKYWKVRTIETEYFFNNWDVETYRNKLENVVSS